ncbi:Signal transduction histidine kinase CheA [hydrothermal vent metagenome]|uniref:Chemotaxis protein CheA n=1 Tax=hydrothermal vent metagenome TaxID=652676 RepID=A0A3B0WJ32_9ZZZZ
MSIEDTFREEADELLVDLEAAMLELEEQPDDSDSVDRAFRTMHTIKGSGSMFGFDKLAAFTHHLENAFDLVRSGDLKISKELISISLDSGDHIRDLLEIKDSNNELDEESNLLLERLNALVGITNSQTDDKAVQNSDSNVEASVSSETQTFRIRLNPDEDAFASGMDPLPILRELQAMGTCNITTIICDLPDFGEMNPEKCYMNWDLILTTDENKNSIEDVFIFVQDDWDINIEMVDKNGHWSDTPEDKNLGEILIERGDATANQIEQACSQQKKIGEILTTNENIAPEKVEAALKEQQVVKKAHKKRKASEVVNVKVPAEKLDILMDLVGELVIAQARLNQSASIFHDPALTSVAEDMERLTSELRDNTLGLRMLPIGTTFGRFRRLVRDLSNDLGKQIELVTEGAETELDKTVIDKLGDPLVHLIRNSIDHGIEMPDVRKKAGKPEKGTVLLTAVQSESNVIVTINDNGAGLDAEAIRLKAIERGVITKNSTPTPQELYNLIFDAGFSTAKVVSNVSGRGVGMDVVRRSIESLRGKVTIDSHPGEGSTITIELPLTLAIIEGLLVKVESEHYVIPLSQIEECIEITSGEIKNANGNHLIEVRGELVPYLRLRECFNTNGEHPDIEQIIVVRTGKTRFGFTVDQVVGQHQTVIKGLGKIYEGIEGLAGATILGDGAVALILDTNALIQNASKNNKTLH